MAKASHSRLWVQPYPRVIFPSSCITLPISSETTSSTSETTSSNPAVTWSTPRPQASLLRAFQGQLAHLQGKEVVGAVTTSQGTAGQWNVIEALAEESVKEHPAVSVEALAEESAPSFPSQPEGKIGLPRANPRGRLRSPS